MLGYFGSEALFLGRYILGSRSKAALHFPDEAPKVSHEQGVAIPLPPSYLLLAHAHERLAVGLTVNEPAGRTVTLDVTPAARIANLAATAHCAATVAASRIPCHFHHLLVSGFDLLQYAGNIPPGSRS